MTILTNIKILYPISLIVNYAFTFHILKKNFLLFEIFFLLVPYYQFSNLKGRLNINWKIAKKETKQKKWSEKFPIQQKINFSELCYVNLSQFLSKYSVRSAKKSAFLNYWEFFTSYSEILSWPVNFSTQNSQVLELFQ